MKRATKAKKLTHAELKEVGELKPQRRTKAISMLERLKTEITNLPPQLLFLYRLLTEMDTEEKRKKKKIEQRLI